MVGLILFGLQGKPQDGDIRMESSNVRTMVKVVLHDDEIRIHGFPTGSARISPKTCMNCGDEIIN